MALKAFIKDLSDVGDDLRSLYRKLDDGSGYIVDVAEASGFNLENISGLTSALEKSKRELSEAATALKQLGDQDPSEIMRKLKRYDEIKDLDEQQIKKQVTQDVRDSVAKEFEGTIKDMADKHERLKNSLKLSALESVKTAIAKAGGEPEFIRAYLNDTVHVDIDDDGKHALQFMNDDGKTPRIKTKDGNVIEYSIDHFIKDLQDHQTYGKIFTSQAASGAGGQRSYQNLGEGQNEVVTKDQLDKGHKTLEDFAKGGVVSQS